MKILLLEDDYNLHKAIKTTLESISYEVVSFYDGFIAYQNLDDIYDIYLLDVNVPHINGIELTKRIKDMNSSASIIIMSGNSDINTIKAAYGSGCDDYLKKPFDLEELMIKISKYTKTNQNGLITLANKLQYDLHTKQVYFEDKKIDLTKKESLFMYLLVSNINNVVSYESSMELLYKDETQDINALRSLLKRLRKKLPENTILRDLGGYMVSDKIIT